MTHHLVTLTLGPLSTCLNAGKKVRTRLRLPMQGFTHSLSHWLCHLHGCMPLKPCLCLMQSTTCHNTRRGNTWGQGRQASRIKLTPGVNYPNQPRRKPGSHLSDPNLLVGSDPVPTRAERCALAETIVILMRYAAIKEINLNTEVQKPSIADVLEFTGEKMECAVEATPHKETSIYSSALEGGTLMQKFEEGELQEAAADGDQGHDRGYITRSEGKYAATFNPWPRDEQNETRDITGVQKRKPYVPRRQGNRWDQYGESSSAASSEAHIMSDYVHSESTWGPYESAHRDQRAAQPYRLQKANRSEGQRSRWASDIRQSQPDYWSSSFKWQSSAGDDGSWKKVSDWEGSQWSAPTRGTLKGSEVRYGSRMAVAKYALWRGLGL